MDLEKITRGTHDKMNSLNVTWAMILIAIVGGTVVFLFSEGFFVNTQTTEFDKLKKAEASFGMVFDATTVFYDMNDKRNTINAEWKANGGRSVENGNTSYLQFIKLNGVDVLTVSWWQKVDGELVGVVNHCGQSVICFNSKNETAFMIIQILDESIKIDEALTLKSNGRILKIEDFNDIYEESAKIITVDLGELSDYPRNSIPHISLFFPTEFTDKCIFAKDYVTCEMNQEILLELQKMRKL